MHNDFIILNRVYVKVFMLCNNKVQVQNELVKYWKISSAFNQHSQTFLVMWLLIYMSAFSVHVAAIPTNPPCRLNSPCRFIWQMKSSWTRGCLNTADPCGHVYTGVKVPNFVLALLGSSQSRMGPAHPWRYLAGSKNKYPLLITRASPWQW